MSHPLPRRAHLSLVRFLAEARRRSPDGDVVSGHHNCNLVAPVGRPLARLLGLPSGRVLAKFRTPRSTVEVVPRIWRREAEVLNAVATRMAGVPRCLADFGDWALHAYLPGQTLAQVVPKGPVGEHRIGALAGFFARLADVPREALPPTPADWPRDGDSRGFLGWLARFTEERVHRPARPRFGALFDAVGIPREAVARFMAGVPDLVPRPFTLLHTDVHRANVVLGPGEGAERLSVIDWELALYGDPLHDLATHVVRMDYDAAERELMIRSWERAMKRSGHEAATAGLDRDLPVYLGFEYAQSVFPDVMRAALALPDAPAERDLVDAAGQVCRALSRAREPLGLPGELPDEDTVAQDLRRWHAADLSARPDAAWEGPVRGARDEDVAYAEQTGMERHGC